MSRRRKWSSVSKATKKLNKTRNEKQPLTRLGRVGGEETVILCLPIFQEIFLNRSKEMNQ